MPSPSPTSSPLSTLTCPTVWEQNEFLILFIVTICMGCFQIIYCYYVNQHINIIKGPETVDSILNQQNGGGFLSRIKSRGTMNKTFIKQNTRRGSLMYNVKVARHQNIAERNRDAYESSVLSHQREIEQIQTKARSRLAKRLSNRKTMSAYMDHAKEKLVVLGKQKIAQCKFVLDLCWNVFFY